MKLTMTNPRFLKFVILAIFLMTSCNKDDVQPGQLITNGDVETGSSTPNGWWLSNGQGNYDVTWSDTESFSPGKSLEISTQTSESTVFAFWAQTITTNLPIGKSVTLKVKVKGNMKGDGISLVIRGDNTIQPDGVAGQFVTTEGTSPISGNFDWTDYSVRLGSVEAGTQSLTIYLLYLPNTTGEVYFDDISLEF